MHHRVTCALNEARALYKEIKSGREIIRHVDAGNDLAPGLQFLL